MKEESLISSTLEDSSKNYKSPKESASGSGYDGAI